LHLVAKRGEEGVVRMLLQEKGSDVNAKDVKGQTALHVACAKGHVGVARLLIEWGTNLEARDLAGRTPLQRAGAVLRERLMRMFAEMGGGVIDACN
jgi:ankyrin repeat protein